MTRPWKAIKTLSEQRYIVGQGGHDHAVMRVWAGVGSIERCGLGVSVSLWARKTSHAKG